MSSLHSPGDVTADIDGRLAISDTGHHRILVGHMVGATLDVQLTIGRGEPGFDDGPLETSAFREPCGLALSGDMLIVADRGNDAVRIVDLAHGDVATMVTLDSPWDLLLHDYDLFIAFGSPPGIGRLDFKTRALSRHVEPGGGDGNGGQPMAVATDGKALYFASAASSIIGRAAFEPGGETEILSEGEIGLPGGVAWAQGNHRLWIADRDAGALKTLDVDDPARIETVEPFEADLAAPSGLAPAGHLLFLADTGNDRILRIDQVDKRVVELKIEA